MTVYYTGDDYFSSGYDLTDSTSNFNVKWKNNVIMSISSASEVNAGYFVGNGSRLTNLGGATDNTKVLKTGDTMSGQLTVQSSITATAGFYGSGSNLTGVLFSPATFSYLVSPATFTYLASQPNTITSSLTITGNGGQFGLSVSSNVYIVGYSSANAYYGDGSHLTGVSTSGTTVSTVTIDALPIGTFIQYGSTTAPSSYLYCDGTSYSTTTYSVLYAVIGYKYGGSGANFTCDFRGMFARGLDTTGTIDSEARVIGSSETDKFQGHNTTIVDPGHRHDNGVWIPGNPSSNDKQKNVNT